MSNTKLNSFEREILRDLKTEMPDVDLFSFPEYNTVVGIERTGETMGRFAVSISAETEQKFRKKVGEYHVLSKFTDGYTLPVYIGESSLSDIAHDIAHTVGRFN